MTASAGFANRLPCSTPAVKLFSCLNIECLCIAGRRPLFEISLRRIQPQHYAVLVATLFKCLGGNQPEVSEKTAEPMADLMLSFLTDWKDMTPVWQQEKLAGVLSKMINDFPLVAYILRQVSLQRLWIFHKDQHALQILQQCTMSKNGTVLLCHHDCICPILLHQEVIVWKMQFSNNLDMILDQKYQICEACHHTLISKNLT